MSYRHKRSRVALCVSALLLFAVTGTVSAAMPVYPLGQSANRRYLVDARGTPYMIVGDSPQALMVNLSETDANIYLADREALGFNTVWVNLLCTTYTAGRPDASTFDGIVPFTGRLDGGSYDITTPNEAYFARVDRVLRLAASHGILVLLDPIETGGFLGLLQANGPDRALAYGQFLGRRYASFPNIIWMSGNDFQDWMTSGKDELVLAVARGIAATDSRHLQTLELDYPVSSSLNDANWTSLLGLNATYTYRPTYAQLQSDYARSRFLPNFLVEANYEFEDHQGPVTTAYILRKQEYWAMTSGAAGQLYGNGYTWTFAAGWRNYLDSPGALDMRRLVDFFSSRAWYALVPDMGQSILIGGAGNFSTAGFVADNDYATAARTPDGRLVVIYTPTVRPLTVNMGRTSGSVIAQWYDPTAGTYEPAATTALSNVGPKVFTPPGPNAAGDGDWVLVLESNRTSRTRFNPRARGVSPGVH